ncbi:hypothetical protein [Streptomyces sp. NPDC020681]|uniref:hypothetical protein n=1 Tax=Streptomyces sp. NPDC020681 TaxID=3365083 RepID=UPI00379AEA53
MTTAQTVYVLFAHEPYYPPPNAQEINATLVAGASLSHPKVRQPDGIRMHRLLSRGRADGEVVSLATLTHELNGGSDWHRIGDWEQVTSAVLTLVRTGGATA